MRIIKSKYLRKDYIGILKNLPVEIINKLSISPQYLSTTQNNEIEVVIISGDGVDKIKESVDNLGGVYEDLGYSFGLVTISVDKVVDLLRNQEIEYAEFPKSLYISDADSNRASCVSTAQNTYNLFGEGVLVGFIDTGIDYTHPAFIDEEGNTRIEYIYDLSEGGTVYNKDLINKALKSSNPFSVVNSKDLVGHGTHVVGIACAGGKIDKKYYGVAPKSSIAMVKVARTRFSLSTIMMRGIKFLIDKSKELNMPLVINISLSTNDGAHNGSSLLEKYIQTVASLERVSIIIAAGNEGDVAHHIGGAIENETEISINVAEDETIVQINLYKSVLPQLTLELISPEGNSSGILNVSEGIRSGVIGQTGYDMYNTGPKPFDISGEIGIVLTGLNKYVSSGLWKLILRKLDGYSGRYDSWLPISEGLNIKTKFLNPVSYNTLGIPATVSNIIAVGSYNFRTNNISSFSGIGQKYDKCYIKPEIVAPGENIKSTIPNRGFGVKSGTSMATPNVTGICTLMTEWGLVRGNDKYLYGERLKYYLVEGARRKRRDITYPDEIWGYGEVCLYESLSLAIEKSNNLKRKTDDKTVDNKQDTYFGIKNTSVNEINGNGTDKKINEKGEIQNSDNIFLIVEVPTSEVFYDEVKKMKIKGIMLSERFGLVLTPEYKVKAIKESGIKVLDIDVNAIFTLCDISPIEASGANVIKENPYLNLKGRGVIVGIIDTGIDYLNAEFQREDDTSRIFRLWDQTIDGDKEVAGFQYGSEYTQEQINEAIKVEKNGGDPYTVVPSKDTNGHGTAMASIIGGRGQNQDLTGIATDCEFIVVKLAKADKTELDNALIESDVESYTPWTILLALRYIVVNAKAQGRPVVIYIPLGSNIGAHDGTGIVENSINNFASQIGTIIITPTGNQGNSETHTEGKIEKKGDYKDIEIKVGKRQKKLPIEICINKPDSMILQIISPSGESVDGLTAKNTTNRRIKFNYEGTEMIISITNPEFSTGDGLILIKAFNLREGIWKFRLIGNYIVNGNYYAWIPQRELIDQETKFLNSIAQTTLTLPSTSSGAVSVAYYNQNNDSVVGESGRGYTRNGSIKPEIAAGGVNQVVTMPGGGTRMVTGSSVAGAVVSGGCALILQWAIVDGNDSELYASQLRTYIIRGARGRRGDIYPNREWGYGIFDLEGIFEAIRESYMARSNLSDNYSEYNVGTLFVRLPK